MKMKSLKLTGVQNKTYDLEELSTGSRTSETELRVHVWEWNPLGVKKYEGTADYEDHKSPNPPNLKVGQIWLSKKV